MNFKGIFVYFLKEDEAQEDLGLL